MRSGKYVQQLQGYRAFIPAPLPPDPAIHLDGELTQMLSAADRALGRLDGVASILPNPSLFVAMYVRHEAVLSSQIEGTQSTLEDVPLSAKVSETVRTQQFSVQGDPGRDDESGGGRGSGQGDRGGGEG
ncbi:hypothetical protein D7Y23_38660, partial [Corallococcus sp. AB050B]